MTKKIEDPPEGEYIPALINGSEDVTGQIFGGYKVLGRSRARRYPNGKAVVMWGVECVTCGVVRDLPSQRVRSAKYGCNKCKAELQQGPKHGNWRGGKHVPGYFIAQFRSKSRKGRARQLDWDLDADYLDKLWEQQEGRCVYTGWPIQFGKQGKYAREQTASLDRIDSTLGYVRGNVQFVHKDINLMKWDHTEERFIELCRAVSEYRKDNT